MAPRPHAGIVGCIGILSQRDREKYIDSALWMAILVSVIRISGGEWKGRRIASPKGTRTRPTSSQLRQSIFNVILNALGQKPERVLDLFAGTGALGIEALSHGARSAVFVESSPSVCKVLDRNLKDLASNRQIQIVHDGNPNHWKTALNELEEDMFPFDLAFCDPPYRKGLIAQALRALNDDKLWISGAVLVAEMARAESVTLEKWDVIKEKSHGDSKVVFFRRLR